MTSERRARLEALLLRERVRRAQPVVGPGLAEALGRDAASLRWLDADRAAALFEIFVSKRATGRWTPLVQVASRERDVFDTAVTACRRLVPERGLVLLLLDPGFGIEVERDEVLDRVDVPIVSDDHDLYLVHPRAGLCLRIEYDTFAGHAPVTYELELWHDERLVSPA